MEKLHRVCKNFTRHDKKTRTILLCEMLEYTNVFLEAAFRAEGYSFETLKNPVKDRTLALRYISNDYCYPTVLILAQFLEYLESGERDPEEITFMEPQAGGACRAGNIYNLLQRVLYRMVEQGQLEYAQIPVISLNLMGEEKHTGFRITPSLLSGGIAAGCYGKTASAYLSDFWSAIFVMLSFVSIFFPITNSTASLSSPVYLSVSSTFAFT
jgi:predicted nucleotide-binding protein (sugar kinase/HSP70/actin superfamily)